MPPAGWRARARGRATAFCELRALAGLLEPPRTPSRRAARQLADASRELLLALRALIDWWVDRLERGRKSGEVQDVPSPDLIDWGMATWVLTGSPENFEATAARRLTLIGMKERRRRWPRRWSPATGSSFYLTRVDAFAAAVRLTGDVRGPGGGLAGQAGQGGPVSVALRGRAGARPRGGVWVPAEAVKDHLEWVRKWPADHWTLAFQGQLRTVCDADAAVLMDAMRARAAVGVGRGPRRDPARAAAGVPPDRRRGGGADLLDGAALVPGVDDRQGGLAVGVPGLHLGRGGDPAGRGGGAFTSCGRAPSEMRFHLPGGHRFLGTPADSSLLVLPIRRLFDEPSISEPTTTLGIDWGSSWRCWRRVRWWQRARGCAPPGSPEPANPIAEEPEWEVPERKPTASAPTAARASTPR